VLSSDGLALLHDSMAAHVAAGHLPGLVTLVAQGDDLHVDTIGSPSFGSEAPLRAIDAELDDTVPAERPITLEDLLSYRFGLGSVMAPPGSYPIQRAEAELGLHSIGGPPWPPVAHDPDGWMAALGSLPLMFQPGQQWLYNTSAQVLGVLLARVRGRDLESVLRERILDPLEMADTGFTVPAAQLGRLTTAYRPDPETGQLWVLDDPADSWWGSPTSFPDASGWLVSTIDDYWSFVSMLLAGGTGPGGRVLSPETVARMTVDRLTPDQRAASAQFLGEHGGWGLGLEVPAAAAGRQLLPCGIGWTGGSGTTWRSSAGSGVTGILFGQRGLTSPVPEPLAVDFWCGVNAASAAA
jgi:CubicO group peptidase (beta-lactamase class C family)